MHQRSGLTLVESVGIMAALMVGLLIGFAYLDVDMREAAYQALEKSQLVEPSRLGLQQPQAAQDDATAHSTAASQAAQPAVAELADQNSNAEGIALTEQSAHDRPAMSGPQQESVDANATRDCWQALSQYLREDSRRRARGAKHKQWQWLDYLMLRQESHAATCQGLQDLNRTAVDPRVLAYADAVLAWHQAGEELYQQAVQIWNSGSQLHLSGPMATSWQSQATQHRMEEKLVRSKHDVVLKYLNYTYPQRGPFQSAYAK